MTDKLADNELIDGCINNNRKAQEQLYKQFYGPMVAICLRYTKNTEDAIEVLHNGFLKVFAKMHTYDTTKAGLFTWIRTIMVRTAIDFIRQHQKLSSTFSLEQAEEPFIDADAIQRISSQELLQLVQKLSPATQAVFNLYVLDGYTHKEIGTLLGISEGTSKWHLSEARKKLQLLLQTSEVYK